MKLPIKSQSTIKMEKGYYKRYLNLHNLTTTVAIHNKNGKGLLHYVFNRFNRVNKESQSTIKMEKGYYEMYSSV